MKLLSRITTVGATHASPGCHNQLKTNGKCRDAPLRVSRPVHPRATVPSAPAGRRPDPIDNPTLRSASDAGWGQRTRKKPSPNGRPPFVPLAFDGN